MKVLVAPDKFKHSLTAEQVCSIIEHTILKFRPQYEIHCLPMADGGEGSAYILAKHFKADRMELIIMDPLMRPINAEYFIQGYTAFIEMAAASGLQLLTKNEQNVLKTSSYGTGELIFDAMAKGCKHIILCIGGSSTHDGGVGMAKALGYQFLDQSGIDFLPVGNTLCLIDAIKRPDKEFIKAVKFTVLTDVDNQLTGLNGAAYQYALQKGAKKSDLSLLDNGLKHLQMLIEQQFGIDIDQFPGSGAAGGMGGGASFFLNGQLNSGINYMAEILELDKKVSEADWVISGEGKLDEQSFQGKVASGVLKSCVRHDKPLTLMVGYNTVTSKKVKTIHSIYSLTDEAKDQTIAIENPKFWLEKVCQKWLSNL